MKKNGLLQTFFLRFFENSSDKLRIVWRNEKGHIGNTWRHVFFCQKGHGAQKKEHGIMKKGHGVAPFYFALDKTLRAGENLLPVASLW